MIENQTGFESSHVVAVEDAANVVVMMQFGTEDSVDAVDSHIPFSGRQHPDERSGEIQLIVGPELCGKC